MQSGIGTLRSGRKPLPVGNLSIPLRAILTITGFYLAYIVAWRLRRKCAQFAIALALFAISAPASAGTIP